jgi:hypothetical protein
MSRLRSADMARQDGITSCREATSEKRDDTSAAREPAHTCALPSALRAESAIEAERAVLLLARPSRTTWGVLVAARQRV